MSAEPLFIMTIARSGGTLLCRMLDAHSRLSVASDPYLPLMRAIRNSLAAASAATLLHPNAPFQDYYFRPELVSTLDAVLHGDLADSLRADWNDLIKQCRSRAAADCSDLIADFHEVHAKSCKTALDRAMSLLAKVRGDGAVVGFKEVWTIELLPALARAYPEARFIILVRDPRAVLASMLALAKRDPGRRGHVLSYCRHWRKYVAFLLRCQQDTTLRSRVQSVRYEDIVTNSITTVRDICRFLGVAFDPRMLQPAAFLDRSSGRTWSGNSSFEVGLSEVTDRSVGRWRMTLAQPIVDLVSLTCGPEMKTIGYDGPYNLPGPAWAGVLRFLRAEHEALCSWRSDLARPEEDFDCELARRRMLYGEARPQADMVRTNFLFASAFDALRARVPLPVSRIPSEESGLPLDQR